MNKMCESCVILPVCKYCAENTEFKFPDDDGKCDMYHPEHHNQSEWISVEDRLPTYKDGKVLIYTAYGISIAEITVSGRWKGANAIPKFITHWMPLPEPPKIKGGESG